MAPLRPAAAAVERIVGSTHIRIAALSIVEQKKLEVHPTNLLA